VTDVSTEGFRPNPVSILELEPPKRIFDLPPEILSDVTKRLYSEDIGSLLLIGNKHLAASLLRDGAVTCLSVAIESKKGKGLISWPQLFNHFRSLRDLSIVCHPTQAAAIGLQASDLPSSLTRVQLPHLRIPGFLGSSESDLGKFLPNLLTLESSMQIDASMTGWVATWPSSLTSVTFQKFDFSVPLPPSVVDLHVTEAKPASLVVFPSALTQLSVGLSADVHPSFLSSLPTTLQTLQLLPVSLDPVEVIWTHLPRTLTCLSILHVLGPPSEDLAGIPPYLTELQVENFEIGKVTQLPPSLQSLNIAKLSTDSNRDKSTLSDFFSFLPDCLTSLYVGATVKLDNNLIASVKMPKPLTKCIIPKINLSSEPALCSLPETLTHLIVGEIAPNMTALPKLPQLKYFEAENMPLLPDMLNHLAHHSTQLESLQIRNCEAIIYDFSTSEIFVIDELAPMAYLITKSNSAFYESSDPSTIFRFSRSLIHVKIPNCAYIGRHFLLDVMPTSIQALSMSAAQLEDKDLTLLSRWTNLSVLALLNAKAITSASFCHLPRSLTRFELVAPSKNEKIASIRDHDFPHLPRSLTEITLFPASHLTDACVTLLPPSTSNFKVIGNKNLTKNILQLLHPAIFPYKKRVPTIETALFKLYKGKFVSE
jgi:hypothetical protein